MISMRYWKTVGYCRIVLHNVPSTSKDVELRCSEIAGGNAKLENNLEVSKKLNMHLSYVPENSLLDIYPWEVNT